MLTRRALVRSLGLAMAARPVARLRADAPRRVLMLGGTGFFGPALVQHLLDAGHRVTLFNRGITNPQLFPELEKIRGDRELPGGEGLAALRGHLESNRYDWVVDTWQRRPLPVRESAALFRDGDTHYHYVSTISVYRDQGQRGIGEDYPLEPPMDVDDPEVRWPYGQRKAMMERLVREALPGRCAIFRSHGMRGFRIPDPTDEPYWPVKFLRGGEILLPDAEDHWCQVTDITSLVGFMEYCGRAGMSGTWNVAYPSFRFRDYVSTLTTLASADIRPVWVPAGFLAEQGIRPYRDLPMWAPAEGVGFYHYDVRRALAAGLVNRPLHEMLRDQQAGYLSRHPEDDFRFGHPGTISAERERELLRLWRERSG